MLILTLWRPASTSQKAWKSRFFNAFWGGAFSRPFYWKKLFFDIILCCFACRAKSQTAQITVFLLHFCVPCKHVRVMQHVLKKWATSGQKSSKIVALSRLGLQHRLSGLLGSILGSLGDHVGTQNRSQKCVFCALKLQ